jgi:hypothetical protein
MQVDKQNLRVSNVRYHFESPAFEFVFQWVLGAQTNGGSEVGECFYAASQVKENDPQSWVVAWITLARSVEQRAYAALSAGHKVSAREAYLRAYTYYRATLMFISPFDSIAAKPVWQRAVECFRQAAILLEPIIEPITIPFNSIGLPGYFIAPKDGQAKRKTLIMIGGADTYVEDLYLFIGPAAIKRGYNLLFVDLLGQGGLPFEGLFMQPDTENQFAKVVDYALARPEVDGSKLAAYGISAGGYIVPRALTVEKRVKAAVACSLISDFHAYMTQNPATLLFANSPNSLLVRTLVKMKKLKPSMVLMDTYAWRWGVPKYADLFDVMKPYKFDPAQIACPILSIIGEKEYANGAASRKAQDEALKVNPCQQSKLVITHACEGADAHSMATNMSLMGQLVFDWLDEVL